MNSRYEALAPFRRFRALSLRYALLSTIPVAALAYLWDPVAARGVLAGSLAGGLGFWIMARRLEAIALTRPEEANFAVLTWTLYRFALYGAALLWAYTFDTEKYHGLAGALAGILIIRVVLMVLGISGAQLPKKPSVSPGPPNS